MPSAHSTPEARPRSNRWVWTLCLVLLGATLLNYANRSVFTQNALPIKAAFDIGDTKYGTVNSAFALGFALGGLTFGILADWISVRILYPTVVLLWSLASIGCGIVDSVISLAVLRFLLAFFEAGHWPCALRTTQRTFKPAMRTLGNSILQSGASVGAVLAPLLVLAIHSRAPGAWRLAFFIVGGLSVPWAVAWLLMVRESDVRRPVIQTDESARGTGEERELEEIPFWRIFATRRWWLLLVVVSCINIMWHYIRVWMPIWLEEDHGYSHEFVQWFTSAYYGATFVGAIASGLLTAALPRWGWNVHRARLAVWLVFGILASLVAPAAYMPKGNLFLATMLLVGFGSLGLFPIYYSLNQEISAKNQGKVGGSLGFSTWGLLIPFHWLVGWIIENHPDTKPAIVTAVGMGPLVAFVILLTLWGERPKAEE